MVNGESYPTRSQPPDGSARSHEIDLTVDRTRAARAERATLAPSPRAEIDDPVASPCVVPAQAPDIAVEDWDILCAAVQARLGLLVAGLRSDPTEGSAGATLDHIRAGVVECADALAQLRATLVYERSCARAVELALVEMQTAYATLRSELAGTRAGERQAWHRALHDSLTSLPNRACFRERLEQAVARAEPERQSLAVMYIDLDGFKLVNDTHGHAIGDEMLRIVAARLTGALRADDLVSRLGGDEFACLLWIVPPCAERLDQLARELFAAVSDPFQLGDLRLTVQPSIGIAVWPTDGATADDLLRHADAAMYRAKRERCGHAFSARSISRREPMQRHRRGRTP